MLVSPQRLKWYLFPKVTEQGNVIISYYAPEITQNSFQGNEFIPTAKKLAPSSGILKKKHLPMSTVTVNSTSTPHCGPGYSTGASKLYTLEPLITSNTSLLTTCHKSYYYFFLLTWACSDYNGATQRIL